MRIVLIVEGKTEKVFLPYLRSFLRQRLDQSMPSLKTTSCDGRIPTHDKLRRMVETLLRDRKHPADAVIALTDVYTGSNPPEFADAADARMKMKCWVGDNDKFFPHAAQHDFEAWLLPYWDKIQKLAGHNKARPAGHPEEVNHGNPPAYRIQEIFRLGKKRSYSKTRDATAILREKDLLIAIKACPELKSFLNTILELCDGETIP